MGKRADSQVCISRDVIEAMVRPENSSRNSWVTRRKFRAETVDQLAALSSAKSLQSVSTVMALPAAFR